MVALVVGFGLTAPTGQVESVSSTPVASVEASKDDGAHSAVNRSDTGPGSVESAPSAAQSPPEGTVASLAAKQPRPFPGPHGYTEYPYTILGTTNDTLISSQWHLSKIQAPTAWDRWTGSSSTTIAVIDTGFALNHEDLSAKWKLNSAEMGSTASQGPAPNCTSRGLTLDKRCNNLDDDGNGYTDDWRGWDFVHDDDDPQTGTDYPSGQGVSHGTMTAGLTAAASDNGRGVAGVDRGALILPLQALDDDGSGFTSSVAEAIRYAADQGADVINLSLGSAYSDSYLRAQIAYAQSLGVVVVAAAGNEGCSGCLTYPANFPEVIAIGATTSTDTLASFSSWGGNLDMVAPGTSGMCTTAWSSSVQTTGYSCSAQGTSFAAPLVSGAASLIAGRQPGISVAAVTTALLNGADKVVAMNGALTSTQYGSGRLNVYRSLQQLALPVSVGGLGGNKEDTDLQLSLTSPRDVITLCRGTYSTCRLRFTGPSGQVVLSPANPVNYWGDVPVQWRPGELGLTAGIWQMVPAWVDGTPSGYPPVSLLITP